MYCYRRKSGGIGEYRGGDGLVREVEFLANAQLTLVADRQKFAPYGLFGGGSGAPAKTYLSDGETERELPSKGSVFVRAWQKLTIETPGGGGWGSGEN